VTLPVERGAPGLHGRVGAMPGSRLEIVEGAGHFPHHADPDRFVVPVREFVASTRPAHDDPGPLAAAAAAPSRVRHRPPGRGGP
jgi:hypothetical protein